MISQRQGPRRRVGRSRALRGADRFDRPRQVRARSCPGLKGPVTVTVSATGYAPVTWIGVNGANLTIPIRVEDPPAVDDRDGQRDDRGLGQPARAGRQPPDAGADRLLAGDRPGRSRQRDRRRGCATSRSAPVLPTSIPANICVRNAAVERLQLAADDPHRAAGALRDHRRPVQQQHARRRHRRHVHGDRLGDQDRAELRRRRDRDRRDAGP